MIPGNDPIIARLITLLSESGDFWIQAQEQDGADEYRMTVLFGGDEGRWFTLVARTKRTILDELANEAQEMGIY